MSDAQYTSKEGDMVDDLCWRKYRRQRSTDVEAVLAANPHLVHNNYRLSAGQRLSFPDLATPAVAPDLTTFWTK